MHDLLQNSARGSVAARDSAKIEYKGLLVVLDRRATCSPSGTVSASVSR